MKNKPSLGNNVRLAMEHPKLPRKQYLSIYFPKKHLQNTLQASSSIYRAFASSNPSILLVLSIFIFTQYEFFSYSSFRFFFLVVHFPYCAWRRVTPDCISISAPSFRLPLAAKSPSTIFPNFIRLAAILTLARHFLAPFSAIKSRFEAGEGVCNVRSRLSAFEFCKKIRAITIWHVILVMWIEMELYNRKCNNNLKRKWKYSPDWWVEEIENLKNSGCHLWNWWNCKNRILLEEASMNQERSCTSIIKSKES